MQYWYNFLPLLILMAATLGLLILGRWKWIIPALGGLYFGVFLLLMQHIPFTMALAKFLTGIMAAVMIMISRQSLVLDNDPIDRANQTFKAVSLVFFWVVIFLLAGNLVPVVTLNYETVSGGLIVITGGLLQLSTSHKPMKVTIGLLTMYAGFDLLYGSLETSVLVNGLLALITLLITLVGIYITTMQSEEVDQ